MSARDRSRSRRRGPSLRDRFLRRKVGAALTSPAGIVVGSVVAAGIVATGAPIVLAVVAGVVGWGVPVARAMRLGPAAAPAPPPGDALPGAWGAGVRDAEDAVLRYRRAVDRCRPGPLLDRLLDLEEEVLESVDACVDVATWGAEAESARVALDPQAMERAARRAGRAEGGKDQRKLAGELADVERSLEAELALVNGRLDEVVGRVVELAARGGTRRGRNAHRAPEVAAAELAEEVEALRDALHELDGHAHPHRREAAGG